MAGRLHVVAIIPARLESNRLPGKALLTAGGVPLIKRVWLAAKNSPWVDETVVAWSERYSDLPESNVLERVRRVAIETKADFIVRMTQDCPLVSSTDVSEAVFKAFEIAKKQGRFTSIYYSNHNDGRDVQVFSRDVLFNPAHTHKEHIIADFTTPPTGLSVNTREELEKVRAIINGR